jgi:hypothetical protein
MIVMADFTLKELVAAARKLSPAEKAALAQTLQVSTVATPTRAQLIDELKALQAADAFDHVESLRNKYANPALADLSDDELRAAIHGAATEWEQELDKFYTDDD